MYLIVHENGTAYAKRHLAEEDREAWKNGILDIFSIAPYECFVSSLVHCSEAEETWENVPVVEDD